MESGEITLFTLDDLLPTPKIGWGEINDLVVECISHEELYGKFRMLNFQVVWNMSMSLREPIPESHRIARGTGGEGGLALVLSKEGAELLLEHGHKHPYHLPDSFSADLAIRGIVDGIWNSTLYEFLNTQWDGDRIK